VTSNRRPRGRAPICLRLAVTARVSAPDLVPTSDAATQDQGPRAYVQKLRNRIRRHCCCPRSPIPVTNARNLALLQCPEERSFRCGRDTSTRFRRCCHDQASQHHLRKLKLSAKPADLSMWQPRPESQPENESPSVGRQVCGTDRSYKSLIEPTRVPSYSTKSNRITSIRADRNDVRSLNISSRARAAFRRARTKQDEGIRYARESKTPYLAFVSACNWP